MNSRILLAAIAALFVQVNVHGMDATPGVGAGKPPQDSDKKEQAQKKLQPKRPRETSNEEEQGSKEQPDDLAAALDRNGNDSKNPKAQKLRRNGENGGMAEIDYKHAIVPVSDQALCGEQLGELAKIFFQKKINSRGTFATCPDDITKLIFVIAIENPKDLERLLKTCSYFRKIILAAPLQISFEGYLFSDSDISDIAEKRQIISSLKHCPRLTSIDLSHTLATDAGLTAIAQNCPHLTNIVLYFCPRITDSGLTAFAQHCTQLTSINLSSTETSNTGLIAIATNCHQLTSINLGHTRIADTGLIAIAHNCPNLTNINLRFTNVTDAGLTDIAQNCPKLTNINLSFCRGITDAGLIAIATNCPQLTSIDLSLCTKITDAGLAAIVQHCPHLTSIYLGYTNTTYEGIRVLRAAHPGLIIER